MSNHYHDCLKYTACNSMHATPFCTKERTQLMDPRFASSLCSLIDGKNLRRYDDCLKYTVCSGKKALMMAGLERHSQPEGYAQLDPTRVGILIGTGMGGLTVFQDGEL